MDPARDCLPFFDFLRYCFRAQAEYIQTAP
jgi:hypothetical protein